MLPDAVAEPALEEEVLRGHEEAADTGGIDRHDRPEGGSIAEQLGDDASEQDAQAHADVPRDEDGGVGRATLIILGHADGHVLESRPQVSVAEADEQGRTVIAENH